MASRSVAFLLALPLFAVASAAQLPGPGLSWEAPAGAVRSFLPSCTNHHVPAGRGETVSLKVWGDRMSVFGLFAAPTATQCVPLPGLGNVLMLDLPIVTVGFGVLTQTSPCLSCPPGYEELRFTLPALIPPGTLVSFQAVGYGSGRPSFTATITAAFP